jgi:hypothetical protein
MKKVTKYERGNKEYSKTKKRQAKKKQKRNGDREEMKIMKIKLRRTDSKQSGDTEKQKELNYRYICLILPKILHRKYSILNCLHRKW